MGACVRSASIAGNRNVALIAILHGAGLRRSEAVGVNLSDYNKVT
jgi:site-specific recombinase XerD